MLRPKFAYADFRHLGNGTWDSPIPKPKIPFCPGVDTTYPTQSHPPPRIS